MSVPPISARIAPIGPLNSAVPLTTRIARYYSQPIGPPSFPLSDLQGWVQDAQDALERVGKELDRLELPLGSEERCRVEEFEADSKKWYENLYNRTELKQWWEHRLYGEALAAHKRPDEQDGEGKEEQVEEEGRQRKRVKRMKSSSGARGKPRDKNDKNEKGEKGKGKGKDKEVVVVETGGQEQEEFEDGLLMDKEARKLTKQLENENALEILRPWESGFYLRKTKISDMNCLPEIRTSTLQTTSNPNDPLSNVLYTITFHAISKVQGRIHTSPVQQTLICLGSNTFYDLRSSLNAGGDAIPVELPLSIGHATEDDDEEEGEQGGELDEMGTISAATRVRISGVFGDEGGGGEEEMAKRREWKEERRVTGSVFAIEGVLYPDLKGEGKKDYAKMVLESIDQVEWPEPGKKFSTRSKPAKATRATTPGSPVDLTRSNDISVDSTPAPQMMMDPFENIDPSLRDSFTPEPFNLTQAQHEPEEEGKGDHKPKFVRGSQMDQIKLGEVPLRVGQPYWFCHQGNFEHVWTVDSIRYRHASDPIPPLKTSTAPYPLTTYLSRQIAQKCHLCDRDPGVLYIVNDLTASENPCYSCQGCFDALHPLVPSKREMEREAEREAKRKNELRKKRRRKKRNSDGETTEGSDEEQVVEVEVEESEGEGGEEEREREWMQGVKIIPTVIER